MRFYISILLSLCSCVYASPAERVECASKIINSEYSNSGEHSSVIVHTSHIANAVATDGETVVTTCSFAGCVPKRLRFGHTEAVLCGKTKRHYVDGRLVTETSEHISDVFVDRYVD